ncbi:conserved oligomeric Golgi complex subunit 7-like [Pomacea canaliculata]|uniref:conserved oligomeric Golgi complex subunit 7-like n=1 Tax=Pomacea canaliculata TaxID=400727 RepID=UPI000D736158|nr:conserved oligomeric Golgi complex subunit 7-like [Pomacea canaliculata]
MDYSKFMDDNFDAKEWVNSAFRCQREPGVSLDQHATTMVMKLQMLIQEVNNILEEASQQALQNLPRVVRELDAVKQESTLLQDQMRAVKQDIESVEKNTAQSMQTLLTLDEIKSRMKMTSDALKEADNWTTLSSDMEEVFQSQDIEKITEKLSGMQQSLQILVDTPDYMEKCQHLEKLKNRLEALVSPQLIAAFNSQNLEDTQRFTHIFEEMGRLPQLYKYYHKCCKTQILQSWKTIVETHSAGKLQEWMTELYDLLHSTWHLQIMWTSAVFKEPVPVIVDMLSDALLTLDPSLSSCFNSHLQQSSDILDALVELKQGSDRFAKSIETAVEAYLTDTAAEASSLERLLQAVYQPYRPYLVKYKVFEEVALSKALDNVRLDHEEVFDTVQLLSESVNKIFSAANMSNDRCRKLSNGCCYRALLEAYKTFFASYTREFRRVLVNIREKCRAGGTNEVEDWSHFQHSLRIIQTCGCLLMSMQDLDKQLITTILQTLAPLLQSWDYSRKHISRIQTLSFQASLFLSSEDEREALVAFVKKLEDGDTPSVLTEVMTDLGRLSEDVHKFAFEIVFAQLKNYLSNVSTMEVWTSQSSGGALTSDLPTFSMAPQEYITKIGQYLMTLPQHLEPFTIQDSPALTIALRHSKLPYTSEQEPPEHLADLWLESVARGTMHVFGEEMLKIPQLTSHGTKQLITDLEYLTNVLDDLGLQTSETLTQIDALLRARPEEFSERAELMPQRLAHTIASTRGLDV